MNVYTVMLEKQQHFSPRFIAPPCKYILNKAKMKINYTYPNNDIVCMFVEYMSQMYMGTTDVFFSSIFINPFFVADCRHYVETNSCLLLVFEA
jgi:hypothetical protein